MHLVPIKFPNQHGQLLDGRIEFPISAKPDGFAVFAHAFTGNKNLKASRYISRSLMLNGIAVLRFDFTGLGDSEGDFADTNFSSNVADIKSACAFLASEYQAPTIIVGHSLGGAASVYAASEIDSVKAVATVGTPSEPEHVTHLLHANLEDIESKGIAEVSIGGRPFTIKKQFLDDLQNLQMDRIIANLNKAILILHSPQDRIVEIDNAADIYHAARHPKSFITLNNADHMLLDKSDALYVGDVIATWAKRYIDIPKKTVLSSHRSIVAQTGENHPTTEIMAGKHGFLTDKSESLGGNDFGPSPYELLAASLGSSTSMTIFAFAQHHGISIKDVTVHLSYDNRYEEDMVYRPTQPGHVEELVREIELIGDVSDEELERIKAVANHCPVYLSLENAVKVETIIHCNRKNI